MLTAFALQHRFSWSNPDHSDVLKSPLGSRYSRHNSYCWLVRSRTWKRLLLSRSRCFWLNRLHIILIDATDLYAPHRRGPYYAKGWWLHSDALTSSNVAHRPKQSLLATGPRHTSLGVDDPCNLIQTLL